MKKKTMRTASLFMAAAMVLSLTACGQNGGGNTTSDGQTQGGTSEQGSADGQGSTTTEQQGNTGSTEFHIFAGVGVLSADNSEKPVVQQMNDAMGITIDWDCVSGDTLVEKKNLVLNAGSDMPDAFIGADLTDFEIMTSGTNGIFIPLEGYINEETMPNLSSIVKERPELLASITMPDGHIYTLPTISEMGFTYSDGNDYYIGAIPQFMAINKDWLAAVNMEMPTTIDELHDVLVAFKENDCNGNGDPTDEIPLSFEWKHWCANMTSLFSAFGFTDYNEDHRAIKDGKVYFSAAQANYRDAMEYFHQWYAEGLIDTEAFSQEDSQYIAKGSSDDARLGVFCWWEIPEVVGSHADEYEYLTFLAGADGTLGVNLNEQGTVKHDTFAVTSSCENPELLMKWADQCYDPILSMQIIYGPIGVYFESEPDGNGVYVETAEAGGNLKAREEFKGPSRQLSSDFGTYYYMEGRAQERLNDLNDVWFKKVTNFDYYPSVIYSMEETDAINEHISDLKDFVAEKAAGWIVNGGAADEWNAYLDQLDKMGVNEVVAAWQSAYDRFEAAK